MSKFYEAVIQQTSASNASCHIAELDKTVTIPLKFLNHALHGDTVIVKQKEDFGFVQKVLSRATHSITGQVQLGEKFAFVRPWSNHYFRDFFVALEDAKGAKDGDVVEIRITDWAKKDRNPSAIVEKVLLHVTPEQYQMYRFGLPTKFPSAVLEEVKQLDTEISLRTDERIDLRHLSVFSIDPDNCVDRDDALSIEHIKDGYRIGVHIADVTHYLKPGTELDREAYLRGNSLYLSNQVVPMLPERLSNDLCSLAPDEDRYCLTLMVQVDAQFEVVDRYVFRSVIRSRKAFTYREAEQHRQDPLSAYYGDLNLLDLIGKRVRKRILPEEMSFSSQHVGWDSRDGQLKRKLYPSYATNKLVQAWMIIANHFISTIIETSGVALYRVHEPMEESKLALLKQKLHHLNFAWDDAQSVYANLNRAQQHEHEHLLTELISRSFRSAYYSPTPTGHFAIGTRQYTHFTSPIRRYADVIAHRILNNMLDSKPVYGGDMERICKHLSGCEKKADRIATETDQLNAIAFIKNIRYEMNAQIINMSKKGILVKTEFYVNAWIDREDITGRWDEVQQLWEGDKPYYIGEMLVVKLKEINYKTNQIYLKIS